MTHSTRSDLDPLPAHLLIPDEGDAPDETTIARTWERLPRESDLDWYLFRAYLDQAYQAGRFQPRNIAELARTLGREKRELQGIAASFRWVQRAGAWDREVDRREKIGRLTDAERAGRAHARFAAKLRGLAELELEKLIARSLSDESGSTMKPREIFDAYEVAIKIEAASTGLRTGTDTVDEQVPDLESLDMQDLLDLKKIVDKAKAKG